MTSEVRLKELAAMLANHPFLVMAIDEINGLESEAAELWERIEQKDRALQAASEALTEILRGEEDSPLVAWEVVEEVDAALSPVNAQAKPGSQEEQKNG